jgi:hypothetical protein
VITVENPVGRLCVARFVPPFDVAQVDKLAQQIRQILTRLGRPAIFCSDIRRVQIFAPDVSDRITALLKSDNPGVERSAVVIGNSSVFGLQMERMFREAGNPGRRVFRTVDAIVTWLDEVLTPPERERIRAHLAQDKCV